MVADRVRRVGAERTPIIEGEIAKIPLSRGLFAIIDASDLPLVQPLNWHANHYGYAVSRKGGRVVFMHRLLLQAKPGETVDHRNGDPRDNRRENIRICTHQQNMQNRRGNQGRRLPKGVTACRGRFVAAIHQNGVRHHLGVFDTPEEASAAYSRAEREAFGDFARGVA
jgi:hypothetical protein